MIITPNHGVNEQSLTLNATSKNINLVVPQEKSYPYSDYEHYDDNKSFISHSY